MSTKEVLQNIHYFWSTVLPNAYFAGNWDEDALENAFQWAKYCEKVSETAINKPYASQLDAYICTIGSSLKNGYPSDEINLDHMKFSSKVLYQALMQNHLIDRKIFQCVLSKVKEDNDIFQSLVALAEMKSLFVALKESLKSEQSVDGAETLWDKAKSEILLDHAQEMIAQHSSKEEMEKWLSTFLSSLCSSKDRMLLLLCMLLKKDQQEAVKRLQKFIINWLLQKITKGSISYESSVACNLWSQLPSMLCSLSCQYFSFYKCHVGSLVECGRHMEPSYVSNVHKWKQSYAYIGPEFTFTDILLHFKILLKSSRKVSDTTKNLLQSLAASSEESPVWQEIGARLL